jgi:hypothetical protein
MPDGSPSQRLVTEVNYLAARVSAALISYLAAADIGAILAHLN